ncbi:probable LRR receptor-like serine/threonine-protein kinase At1g53430 [Sesamum indicum]|nr:probable LRR receptor-like serine/threonine-protein kinase At1g53430 [Sesamum indicum]
MKFSPSENFFCLLDWALVLQKKGSLMELVDPRLGSNFNKNEAEKIIRVALLCTSPAPTLRPAMSEVVSMLEGHVNIQEFNMDSRIHDSELKLQALREKYDELYDDLSKTQTHVHRTSSTEEKENSSKSVLGSDPQD